MSTARKFDVLIVGGGHAGAQAASMLRQHKYEKSVAIITEEPDLPYQRPPLSKEYLVGDKSFEQILLLTADALERRAITLIGSQRVVAVDPAAHTVRTAAGETIGYGTLVWGAGGSPRRLNCAGSDLRGVHTIRARADVDRLLKELEGVDSVVVIGGGYIGLEAAAVLRKLNKRVTLLEAMDRVLARVAGEPLSRFYEEQHRAHGVDLRCSVRIECLEGRDGAVNGVRLADGTVIPAGIVIVGVGINPEVKPLVDAGAEAVNGVRVDEYCRTSLPDIYAVGDCAEHHNRFAGNAWVRIESVQNANDQATVVARHICGVNDPYHTVPWFWSNQYDLKLQTVGLSLGYDEVVVRGDVATRSFSVVYLRQGQIIALDCVNSIRDYTHGKALVIAGIRPDRLQLANATIPLKSLLPPASAAAAPALPT